MKIKHSKFKNTGLIYELLVKQITSDLVARNESPAVNIVRKYFSGNSALVEEYNIYKTVVESSNLTTVKADNLISAALQSASKLNQKKLRELKYSLISEIKNSYDVEEFFSTPVVNYKPLAAFYCLLEANNTDDLVDPQFIVTNKVTLLEHLTNRYQPEEDVTDRLIKEYSSYDKDLRLLTFKVLLEKFNQRYGNLLPEQKDVLRHFISINSQKALKGYVNEQICKIQSLIDIDSLPKGIERIKLIEAKKLLQPLSATDKVQDEHLVKILQFYDLLAELKKV